MRVDSCVVVAVVDSQLVSVITLPPGSTDGSTRVHVLHCVSELTDNWLTVAHFSVVFDNVVG